jgi:hypothetical protein
MKRTDLPASLKNILRRVPYVTLATVCPNGQPWNTPVWGYFDDELNLYWASWPGNQHSLNIATSPSIFVVVYDSAAPEGTAMGIYMEMDARMLSSRKDIAQGRKVYTTQFGENLSHEPFAGTCPRRLYKATLKKAWHNSDSYIKGNFIDIRREVMPPAA